jgi:hypothetical protein
MSGYEYYLMTHTGPLPPDMSDPATAFLVIGGKSIEVAEQACAGFQGGGWELTSHDIAFYRDHMLVSFMLRRPKPS